MENTYVSSQTEGQGREESFGKLGAERVPSGADGLISSESHSKRLVQRRNSIKEPYRQSRGGINCSIPRHVVNLDEKYIRRFFELIHVSASKATTCRVSSSGMVGILAGGSNPAETKGEGTFDTTRFVFECPLMDEAGSVSMHSAGQGIVGSVMGSKSMTNLLKSPLYCQFGSSASDGDVKLRTTNSEDDICYNFMNSPGGLTVKEVPISENHKFGSWSLCTRFASVSSSNSTSSYQSCAASASASQGMIQCTWKGGSPHFVFSVDGEKEIYVANLSKVDSADGGAVDYVYLLHSTKTSPKGHEICDLESDLVGKIEVSTCFTIGPNNSKIKESEFVLYGNHMGEIQSAKSLKKPKALSKKVVDVLRSSHTSKQRTISKFIGSGTITESCSRDPCHDTSNMCEDVLPPSFELAAIVVKDRQWEGGGWGMKFLKNRGMTGGWSMSMDVVVPAGVHGGPRTSSLVYRWKRGCCDCGGWDMGCKLTVFSTRPNIEATEGECKTFDLFMKGWEQSAASLRMVNVGDGFYLIKFQSVLSALQSFSIAVALLHSQSPNFR